MLSANMTINKKYEQYLQYAKMINLQIVFGKFLKY